MVWKIAVGSIVVFLLLVARGGLIPRRQGAVPVVLVRPTPRTPPSGSFVKSKPILLNDIRLPIGKVMKVETSVECA